MNDKIQYNDKVQTLSKFVSDFKLDVTDVVIAYELLCKRTSLELCDFFNAIHYEHTNQAYTEKHALEYCGHGITKPVLQRWYKTNSLYKIKYFYRAIRAEEKARDKAENHIELRELYAM